LPEGEASAPCELAGSFKDFELVGNILSIPMEYYTYTQGAHGISITAFLNYDISTGKEIVIKDIFLEDPNYLQLISDYAKNELMVKLVDGENPMSDASWVKDGIKPVQDNYEGNIGFSQEGIVVVYQPYQVAAYAAGPQTVLVPYDAVAGIIDPDGLLKDFPK
jgi:hypothetical protein